MVKMKRLPAAARRGIPENISPMLAVLSEMPKNEQDYGFEFKWDGYRTLCYFDGLNLKLQSRNRIDFTPRFPEVSELARQLPYPVILDGEVIATDAAGRPDFGLLQRRTELFNRFLGKKAADKIRITYIIFDLLYDNSRSIMSLTYPERRERLERLRLEGGKWRISPVQYGSGSEMFGVAEKHELEGLIAKKLSSTYEEGRRSPNWKKIKIVQSQEFVLAGWQPGDGANEGGIRSLLLGYYENGKLHYAGNVGTGFSNETRAVLHDFLAEKESAANPFDQKVKGKGIRFLKPELAAEIEFRGWTADDKVRQASFKGIRIDKDPGKIIRERKVKA